MTKLFVFGLGYTGARAAEIFHQHGFEVAGTSRTIESAHQMVHKYPNIFTTASNVRNAFVFDGTVWNPDLNNDLTIQQALDGVTHMIISIPTGRTSGQEDPVLFTMRDVLVSTVQSTLQWLAYLSTIGVYGETNGIAVDESAPVQSAVPRCQMRIIAEQQWLDTGLPTHIFRIAGIYGPDRGTVCRVRTGTATRIHLPGKLFNRIHVKDLVNILVASAHQPNPGAIYNVADDEPAPAEQVTAYACELLGKPVVPLQSWEEVESTMSAMAKSFYAESKVVLNTRIKQELGVKLIYPTYREGLLAQVLEEEGQQVFPLEHHGEISSLLVVLVNIGSLKPVPYIDLRQVSFCLSRVLCYPVVPCSFRFSDRIDPTLLHNLPAKTLETVLSEYFQIQQIHRSRRVVVLPLFFGNSSTLTEFLPSLLHKVWNNHGLPYQAHIGQSLVDTTTPQDDRIAQILKEKVELVLPAKETQSVSVIVVEHGSPNQAVHESTLLVTKQLLALLQSNESIKRVESACMERRQGEAYDFNDPLLVNALEYYQITSGVVIIALLFHSHGRHAGEKGDIEMILDQIKLNSTLEIRITEPIGSHPLLTEILHDRYRNALNASPHYSFPHSE